MKLYLELIIMILVIITGFLIPIAFRNTNLHFNQPVLNYIHNKYNA